MTAKKILLFDVDGTLTIPRGRIDEEMLAFMDDLTQRVTVGIVGGSDLSKIQEQLGADCVDRFPFVFSENGLLAHASGKEIGKASLLSHLGETNLQRLINYCLRYIADLDLPQKRGTFVEFRAGMLNVSPIGRNCSREERDAFEAYDKTSGIRAAFVAALQQEFTDLDLTYSVGGQISFDIFPKGWDKTYCLRFLPETEYDTVHFFGDKTYKGGNDYEIFEAARTIGHTVTSPADTRAQVRALLKY